jgi:ribosomal protein S18 acetylase RimI-like enzyme
METSRESDEPVRLRAGTPVDARFAAQLHAERIGEGFLSHLGSGFLTRLYRRVVASPDSFLLIAHRGDQAVGFLAGTTDVSRLYRSFLLRDGVTASLVAGPRLVRSLPRAVETLRYGTRDKPQGALNEVPEPAAELLAIAVSPSVEGRGLGHILVTGFFEQLAARGVTSARVVVGGSNSAAISLYRRAGFDTVEELELHRGSKSLLMKWPSTLSDSRTVDGP